MVRRSAAFRISVRGWSIWRIRVCELIGPLRRYTRINVLDTWRP